VPKVIRSSRATPQHTRVGDASSILKRFYIFERQLMRALAGWYIQTPGVELKFFLGGEQWLSSQHADSLRARVLELRYPRRDVDKKWDQDLLVFMDELLKAANLSEFLAGVYDVALAALRDEIQEYLDRTDPLDDAPTVYRLRHIAYDTATRIEQMHLLEQPDATDTSEWRDYLSQRLASIGGLSGLHERDAAPIDPGRPGFQVQRSARRDPRFRTARFHLPHENKYDKAGAAAWKRIESLDKRVAMQVWSAISHFNEIWAGEAPASVLFDLSGEPWDFYLDLSRWIWDETRHSMMGYRAMQGWGWDVPSLIPYGDALYNALGPMPPAQRLALLYYFEEGLLRSGTKQVELKILEASGDDGSAHDMDYDWADEAIHVGYGFKWLRHLLGDDNAGQAELTRLTDEARAIFADYVKAHKDDEEAKLAPYFERLYDVVAQMTLDVPEDGLEIQWAPVVADQAVLEDL